MEEHFAKHMEGWVAFCNEKKKKAKLEKPNKTSTLIQALLEIKASVLFY